MQIIFLPGAIGAADFWHPLGELLPDEWGKTYLSWPGFGEQPHHPHVNGYGDLVGWVEREIAGPTVLVTQSLAGVVGIRLACKHPSLITHLILVATSGGVEDRLLVRQRDWVTPYREAFPEAADWVTDERPGITPDIPGLQCPTLLLWSDTDPFSPIEIGQHLHRHIRNSSLCVIRRGSHDFGNRRARQLAPLVVDFLTGERRSPLPGPGASRRSSAPIPA